LGPGGRGGRKDLAYAWRQVLFFVSLPGVDPGDVLAGVLDGVDGDGPPLYGWRAGQPSATA
jgi:hypothetical protein